MLRGVGVEYRAGGAHAGEDREDDAETGLEGKKGKNWQHRRNVKRIHQCDMEVSLFGGLAR
jgi:hypothetical protein